MDGEDRRHPRYLWSLLLVAPVTVPVSCSSTNWTGTVAAVAASDGAVRWGGPRARWIWRRVPCCVARFAATRLGCLSSRRTPGCRCPGRGHCFDRWRSGAVMAAICPATCCRLDDDCGYVCLDGVHHSWPISSVVVASTTHGIPCKRCPARSWHI